jgi:hypothetical protein
MPECPEEREEQSSDTSAADVSPRPRAHFALVLIALLGTWKLYEAFAAPSMRIAIPASLYAFGLAVFAMSLLGPRRWQLAAFFAGAALCLAATALEISA